MFLSEKIVWRWISWLENTTILIGKYLDKNFKFHNKIDINNDILLKFPSFYQDIFIKSINNYTEKATLPSIILSEFIWFNVVFLTKTWTLLVNCAIIMQI